MSKGSLGICFSHQLVRPKHCLVNPVDWLSAFLYTLDILSEISGHLRGVGMNSDLVPLFSLLFLAGGVIFWMGVVLAVVVGIFRVLRSAAYWIEDVLTTPGDDNETGGTMPQYKS